jgi:hypothetical protein
MFGTTLLCTVVLALSAAGTISTQPWEGSCCVLWCIIGLLRQYMMKKATIPKRNTTIVVTKIIHTGKFFSQSDVHL